MTDFKLLFKAILEKISIQIQDSMWVANGGDLKNVPDWKSPMASRLLEVGENLEKVLGGKPTKVVLHKALVQGVAMRLAGIDDSMLSYKYSYTLPPSERAILLEVLAHLLAFQNEACAISSRPISVMRDQATVLTQEILELSKSLDPNQVLA